MFAAAKTAAPRDVRAGERRRRWALWLPLSCHIFGGDLARGTHESPTGIYFFLAEMFVFLSASIDALAP